jgi:hypothetical protein
MDSYCEFGNFSFIIIISAIQFSLGDSSLTLVQKKQIIYINETTQKPPSEVGDQTTQSLEERPVEHDTRIPKSWWPIAVEDD